MHLLRSGLVLLLSLAPVNAFAAFKLEVGKPLPSLSVSGEHGGIVKDGGSWESQSMKGTLTLLLYVDPDDSDLNNVLTDRLKKEKFPEDLFRSVAVINMAATWKPNMMIMKVLKSRQEEFPRTTYVFDKDRYVSQNWGLVPEGYHVVLVDRDGSVLYEKSGKLENAEVESFVSLVKSKVKEAEVPVAKTPETVPTPAAAAPAGK